MIVMFFSSPQGYPNHVVNGCDSQTRRGNSEEAIRKGGLSRTGAPASEASPTVVEEPERLNSWCNSSINARPMSQDTLMMENLCFKQVGYIQGL
jgi:hypothetical protein